ncbi:hypothetical protein FOCC_FOCC014008 [Frankliniella occidentalis]|uniref:Uncharacterized protein LOC113214871 n=1 Tax=Frankliniella occidentalis TaxID=133901 RepID=A0A6J1TH24_FRAOC|nr:uncharacterized protein LOC113214871 [Frankliniella occidentalis]KAE8740480.1 hypothetical protein FOCC_FOCC014008 [Frankliniella occidentalis]
MDDENTSSDARSDAATAEFEQRESQSEHNVPNSAEKPPASSFFQPVSDSFCGFRREPIQLQPAFEPFYQLTAPTSVQFQPASSEVFTQGGAIEFSQPCAEPLTPQVQPSHQVLVSHEPQLVLPQTQSPLLLNQEFPSRLSEQSLGLCGQQQQQPTCATQSQADLHFDLSTGLEFNPDITVSNEAVQENWEFQPEQELSELISLMTVGDEDHEFNPEDYDYQETVPENGNSPLYNGAPITFHESLIAILTFSLSFHLSGACIKALFDLIFLHLPKTADNIFKTSLSAFKNYFSYIQGPKIFKYYCSKCFVELPAKTKCATCKNSKICYIVKLSMQQQLQAMLKRTGFYNMLKFNCDHVPGHYSDVYDGELYQDLKSKGVLGQDVLTLQWYTDGAALFSSSKMNVWPLYFSINELPYSKRFKKENLLVPLIWCGTVKPPSNLLISEVHDDLQELKAGVKFEVAGEGEKDIRAEILNGTGDTPARSLMLNMTQFNGACSCQVCEQDGEPRPGCPGVRLFPFDEDKMEIRTLENMRMYGNTGTELHPTKGVKGPCALDSVMSNYVVGTGIDVMHQLFGGVNKKVLKNLLSTKAPAKKWSISQHQKVLDERLLSIKPPMHVVRCPRSLNDVSYWKTSELKLWLNDYSLPVLNGVLPDSYLKHHGSLVAASHLLNANTVTSQSLDIAGSLLKKYVSQYSDFYDPNQMTMNVHLLLHLPQTVANLGPAWVSSCFPLESINGVILKLVHGTRWAEKQIATSVQLVLNLPELVSELPDSSSKTFCKNVMDRRKHKTAEVLEGSAIIGKCETFPEEDIPLATRKVLQSNNIFYKKMLKFKCLKRGRYVYVAASSNVSTCRDSTAAKYKCNNESNIGFVQTFLRLYVCECADKCSCASQIFALIQKAKVVMRFKTLIPDVEVPNVCQYKRTKIFHLVPPSDLEGSCIVMNINQKLYISVPLNDMEVE